MKYRPLSPAPVIDPTTIRTVEGNGYSPSLAADPLNPNRLVSAFIRTEDDGGVTNKIVFKFTNNGGQSSFTVEPADLGVNTNLGVTTPTGIDPKASDPEGGVFLPFTRVGTPQLTFDRNSNVYLTYAEYNDDNTSGRIILRRFNFTGTGFTEDFLNQFDQLEARRGETTIYEWVDEDEAYNPTVAIDNNLATFTDPDTSLPAANRVQTDGLAERDQLNPITQQPEVIRTRVFVAWNTNNQQPANFTINPRIIGWRCRMTVAEL